MTNVSTIDRKTAEKQSLNERKADDTVSLKKLDLKDEVPIAADLDDFEGTIADAVDADLQALVKGANAIAGSPEGNNDELSIGDIKGDVDTEAENTVSARALELQRKKSAASAMRQQLQDGADLLGDLVRKNDALISYLAKSEQELLRLEAVERRSKSTNAMAEDLIRKHKALNAKFREQQHQIDALEAAKTRNRSVIANARAEIDRLKQQADTFRHDCEAKDVSIAMLEDGRAGMTEKIEALTAETASQVATARTQSARIEELESALSSVQNELNEAIQTKDALIADKETAQAEFDELNGRFQSLTDEQAELKTQLDEKGFEIDLMKTAQEEAASLKDARIRELESNLIAVKKVLMAGEFNEVELPVELDVVKAESKSASASRASAKPKSKAPKSQAA